MNLKPQLEYNSNYQRYWNQASGSFLYKLRSRTSDPLSKDQHSFKRESQKSQAYNETNQKGVKTFAQKPFYVKNPEQNQNSSKQLQSSKKDQNQPNLKQVKSMKHIFQHQQQGYKLLNQSQKHQKEISYSSSNQSDWTNFNEIPQHIYIQAKKMLLSERKQQNIGQIYQNSTNNNKDTQHMFLKHPAQQLVQTKTYATYNDKLEDQNIKLKEQKRKLQMLYQQALQKLQQMEIQDIKYKENSKKQALDMKNKQALVIQQNNKFAVQYSQKQLEVAKLKSQLKFLQEKLEQYKGANTRIISQYDIKNKYLGIKEQDFKQTIKKLQQQVQSDKQLIKKCGEQLRKQKESDNQKIEKLKKQLNQNLKTAQKAQYQLKTHLQSQIAQIARLTQKESGMVKFIQKQMKEKQNYISAAKMLEKQLSNVKYKLNNTIDNNNKVNQLVNVIEVLEKRLQTQKSQNAKLNGECARLLAERAELINENAKLNEARTRLNGEVRKKDAKINELAAKNRNQTGNVQQLKKIIDKMK